MTSLSDIKHMSRWHRVVALTALCLFVMALVAAPPARKGRSHRKPSTRPEDTRVYLLHADVLKHDVYGPNPEAQIVVGHVRFLHRGATLSCDSAYYYQQNNSFRAFGHVRYTSGDTLSLTCDHAWYDGDNQLMEARQRVVLRHRRQTLRTDSLNYDQLYGTANFSNGGSLVDGNSRLTSDWGEYNTQTKRAVFYYDVQLRTPRNHVTTDTLYYDTNTSLAHVVGMYTSRRGQGSKQPSLITSTNGSRVTTTDGYFNTKSDHAELFGRSTVVSKEKTITGDTIFYDSKTGDDRGLGNVIYVDSKNRNKLIAGEVVYNEAAGRGFATRRALAIDYSQPDTLYVHADTMRIETFNINTDSVYRKVHGYRHARVYRRDLQAVCDSMVFSSQDSCLTMYQDPIVWSDQRQLVGEVIKVYLNDSTVREAQVLGQAFSAERLTADSTRYNQISSKDMYAYFTDGQLRRNDAVGNVIAAYYPVDDKDTSLIGLNHLESDTLRLFISAERKMERIWTPKVKGTLYPMTQIPHDQLLLQGFAWFDYIRPRDPDDVFNWRGKAKGTEIKSIKRNAPPLQTL